MGGSQCIWYAGNATTQHSPSGDSQARASPPAADRKGLCGSGCCSGSGSSCRPPAPAPAPACTGSRERGASCNGGRSGVPSSLEERVARLGPLRRPLTLPGVIPDSRREYTGGSCARWACAIEVRVPPCTPAAHPRLHPHHRRAVQVTLSGSGGAAEKKGRGGEGGDTQYLQRHRRTGVVHAVVPRLRAARQARQGTKLSAAHAGEKVSGLPAAHCNTEHEPLIHGSGPVSTSRRLGHSIRGCW